MSVGALKGMSSMKTLLRTAFAARGHPHSFVLRLTPSQNLPNFSMSVI